MSRPRPSCVCLILLLSASFARAVPPTVANLTPRGAERAKAVEVVITGGPTQTFSADETRSDLLGVIGSTNHGFTFATPMLSTGVPGRHAGSATGGTCKSLRTWMTWAGPGGGDSERCGDARPGAIAW